MKVTYIHHDGFLVECRDRYLLFDYYQGEIPEMDPEKPLYVFASHRHGDHFVPDIFLLAEKYSKIHYILAKDIWISRVPEALRGQTVRMGWRKREELDGMGIRTLKSTDEGVAFLVEVEGTAVYHAGDLNDWRWNEESPQWNEAMHQKYIKGIACLEGERIHCAFLPLDPRQEEWYWLGLDKFMKNVGAEVVFPMHFWEDFDVIRRLKAEACSEGYRHRIMEITRRGEEFWL